MDQSTTPGAGHGRTRCDGDPGQFTFGLIYLGGPDHCYGKSPGTVEPAAALAPRKDEVPHAGPASVSDWRTEMPQTSAERRRSGSAAKTAPVRYDRRGLGL